MNHILLAVQDSLISDLVFLIDNDYNDHNHYNHYNDNNYYNHFKDYND